MGKKLQDHPLLWGIIRRFLMAGAVSVTFGILYRWQNIKIDRLEFLLNAIITSATACSGFILASVSILVSLSNTPLMKKINSTDAKKELQYRYKENLVAGLVLIIVSIIIGTNTGEEQAVLAIGFYPYMGIIGFYLISTVRTCKQLLFIIDYGPESEKYGTKKKSGAPKGEYRIGKQSKEQE